jgi:hypothetical protein
MGSGLEGAVPLEAADACAFPTSVVETRSAVLVMVGGSCDAVVEILDTLSLGSGGVESTLDDLVREAIEVDGLGISAEVGGGVCKAMEVGLAS